MISIYRSLPNSKLHQGFPSVSGILKDDAVTLLRRFYESDNPRGMNVSILTLLASTQVTPNCITDFVMAFLTVEDSKKRRKKQPAAAAAEGATTTSQAVE